MELTPAFSITCHVDDPQTLLGSPLLTNQLDANETRMTWLALFTTMGTLVFCALPITLVTLGMGATMASLVSNVPFLVTLSQY